MYRDMHDYCKSCDASQKIGGLAIQSLPKLITSLLEEPFMKWGLDLWGQVNQQGYIKGTNIFLLP
jgi:hypothetical protein